MKKRVFIIAPFTKASESLSTSSSSSKRHPAQSSSKDGEDEESIHINDDLAPPSLDGTAVTGSHSTWQDSLETSQSSTISSSSHSTRWIANNDSSVSSMDNRNPPRVPLRMVSESWLIQTLEDSDSVDAEETCGPSNASEQGGGEGHEDDDDDDDDGNVPAADEGPASSLRDSIPSRDATLPLPATPAPKSTSTPPTPKHMAKKKKKDSLLDAWLEAETNEILLRHHANGVGDDKTSTSIAVDGTAGEQNERSVVGTAATSSDDRED